LGGGTSTKAIYTTPFSVVLTPIPHQLLLDVSGLEPQLFPFSLMVGGAVVTWTMERLGRTAFNHKRFWCKI